ncbi:MAG: RAMP superfamily CRISPR-associated protein [Oscillatoriaceae cyanobacterium Prado104]|jgi:CRISPR-associated protein Cmr4|nr:RAMP superfamily CRISPR-associated protein [Oscillatoriaceae cyanobacterium Prado104]
MYRKAYGIIETLAPLHVGASAGEETGNLNLIFRDQFTKTGIIPGSSIRGRFRADMRQEKGNFEYWYGKDAKPPKKEESDKTAEGQQQSEADAESQKGKTNESDRTTEGLVKFEYASILWLPVYCPGQPIVRVSCPSLLKRYQKLAGLPPHQFEPYSYFSKQPYNRSRLFFNLGSLPLKQPKDKDDANRLAEIFKNYLPDVLEDREEYLVFVVKDREMEIIHDMALYRQSRVSLKDDEKVVDGKAFFNVEALPEKTVLIFPLALKKVSDDVWQNFKQNAQMESEKELYFGGLESVGFGRCLVNLKLSPESQPKEGKPTNVE